MAGGIASLIAAASIVLVYSTLSTASAGFAASTSNESSLFEAAAVDLTVGSDDGPDTRLLRVDVEGLYPGLVVERCLPVTYEGDLDGIRIRLSGRSEGGSGLDGHLLTAVEVGSGVDPDCRDFEPGRRVFDGRLRALWEQHGSFTDGIPIMASADDGDRATVRIGLEVASDDAAQGLDTAFVIVVEARP